MGFRVNIPGNKPELEFIIEYAFSHPLKGFEVKNKNILKSLGFHASGLIKAGVLDLSYNRVRKTTTIMGKSDTYRKISGRGSSVDFIVGDKISNTIEINLPFTKKPLVDL